MFVFYIFFLMILRPPRATRTDTLCPYTALFRSDAPCNLAEALLRAGRVGDQADQARRCCRSLQQALAQQRLVGAFVAGRHPAIVHRSEEHTSELQSLMRTSFALLCLKTHITPISNPTHCPHQTLGHPHSAL